MKTRNAQWVCSAIVASTFGAAHAGMTSWSESADGGGDAGELLNTAQIVSGSGPLLQITGNNGIGGDVDLYQIFIDDPTTFSASADHSIIGNSPLLFLFDASGIGVSFHGATAFDDPSVLTDQFVNAPGIYYLAATSRTAVALDSTSSAIWSQTLGTESAPDGPGAPGPLDAWDASFVAGGNYTITLTGTSFVPAPGALALLGIAGIAGRRRRRAA